MSNFNRKKSPLNIYGWKIVYVIWFGMVVLLITGAMNRPHGGLRAPEELLSGVNLPAESTWMGVYLNQVKIGYVHTEIQPLEPHGYEIREFSRMQGAMMGAMQQMRMRMTVQTDSTLALVSFEGLLEADPYTTSFSGSVVDKVLEIIVTSAGKNSEKYIPAPEPIYLSQAIKPLLQAGRLGEGDSLKLAGFDPMTLEMQDLIVIGAPMKPQRLWGEDVIVRQLKTRLSGFESTVYVDDKGNTLAEYGPLGMLMRREKMEVALTLDDEKASVDFLAIYSIQPTGSINAPRKAETGRYRISGLDLQDVIDASDRQEMIDFKTGIIRVERYPEAQSGKIGDFEKYTNDAPYIESRQREIIEAARNAVRGGETLLDSLGRLNDWVFHAVKKRPAAGLPSALAVLHNLQGDCNEHSALFTALARSLDVPAKIQLGVVYQAGQFYYHAWTACWVDGVWIELDPTFGQRYADAAHIALASGDLSNSIELVNAIGNIEIEILDVD